MLAQYLGFSEKVRENLLQWDSDDFIPLSSKQKDSYIILTTQKEEEIPSNLPPLDQDFESSSQEDEKNKEILNSEDFIKKYDELKQTFRNKTDEKRLGSLSLISEIVERCENILLKIDECLEFLTVLKTDYVMSATKTHSLHEACEMMVDEQKKCVEATDSLDCRLKYFTAYQSINKKINLPFGLQNDHLIPLLSQIDSSLTFLSNHKTYLEAENYLDLFEQCLSKVLNSLKSHVCLILKKETDQFLNSDGQLKEDIVLTFGKMRSCASKVKPFISKIEESLETHKFYKTSLDEILKCYFHCRTRVINSYLTSSLSSLSNSHPHEPSSFLQSGCFLLSHVCEDEYNLFSSFFTLPSPLLSTFLESLSMKLYDNFRPQLIRMMHVETLSEICRLLKSTFSTSTQLPHLSSFSLVVSQLLQDAQERLVFRIHVMLEKDIREFKPSPGDLNFSGKMKIVKELMEQRSKKDVAKQQDQTFFCDMWYPPVRRTLITMSKLFECLDKKTFHGISQDLIEACVFSLLVAMEAISKEKGVLEGEIFLIKHLLILREQIIPFHIHSPVKETFINFTNVKNAVGNILKTPSQLFTLSQNSFLFLILQGVTEKYLDGRKTIDEQLKKSCEKFISYSTNQMIGQLIDFQSKTSNFDSYKNLRLQPFASPENLNKLITQTIENIKNEKAKIKNILSLFLSNEETEAILFKPIHSNVLQTFHHFDQLLLSGCYDDKDKQIIQSPPIEEVKSILTS